MPLFKSLFVFVNNISIEIQSFHNNAYKYNEIAKLFMLMRQARTEITN